MFAAVLTLTYQPNLLISTVLFFGLPSLYIIANNPGICGKSLTFAFFFSIPLSLFVDALAAADGSWVVRQSILPWRALGVATVEVYVYGLLWVLFAVLFYEHFFDRGRKGDRVSPRIKYLAYLFVVLVFLVSVIFLEDKALPKVPYFYSLLGSVFVVPPVVIFIFRHSAFLRRFALIGVYFFFFLLLFELVALTTDLWSFPGNDFVGFVSLLGCRFPIEEVLFWMCAGTPSLLVYYEVFADDRRLNAKLPRRFSS